jgi:hypothetical protein
MTTVGEPRDHFGHCRVEISLIRAVRTHALCTHTQECFGRRHRRGGRLEAAAHEPHLVAHTLHTHAYVGLIRPEKPTRETRISDKCRNEKPLVRRLHPGTRCAPDQRSWWRGFATIVRLRATNPTLLLVTALALCSRLGGCPTQRTPRSVGLPRNPVPSVRCPQAPVIRRAAARQRSRHRRSGGRRSAGGPGWRSHASGTAQPTPRSMRPPRRSPGLGSGR